MHKNGNKAIFYHLFVGCPDLKGLIESSGLSIRSPDTELGLTIANLSARTTNAEQIEPALLVLAKPNPET